MSEEIKDDSTVVEETTQEVNTTEQDIAAGIEPKEEVEETEDVSDEENKEESKESEEESDEDSNDKEEDDTSTKSEKEEEIEDTADEVESSLSNISELTDGEFETVEDLIADRNDRLDSLVSGDNLMESLDEKSNEVFGISFSEVLSFKNEDYDELDDFEVIVRSLMNDDEGITDREIDSELREFKLLKKSQEEIDEMIKNEEITQDDVDDLDAKLTRKARTARKGLKEYQDSIDLSVIQLSQPKQKEEAAEQELTEEEIEANDRRVDDSLKSFEGLNFKLGSKEAPVELPVVPSDDEKSRLKEMVQSQTWLADRWKGEDGEIDGNKAFKDMYFLENMDKITSTIYNEGVTAGVKNNVKEEDNITLGKGRTITDSTSMAGMTDEQKIAASI